MPKFANKMMLKHEHLNGKPDRPETKKDQIELRIFNISVVLSVVTYVGRMWYSRQSFWMFLFREIFISYTSDHLVQIMLPIYEMLIMGAVEIAGFTFWYSVILLSVCKCCCINRKKETKKPTRSFVVEERNILDKSLPEIVAPTRTSSLRYDEAVIKIRQNPSSSNPVQVPHNPEMSNAVQFYQNEEAQIPKSQHIYPIAPIGSKNLKI